MRLETQSGSKTKVTLADTDGIGDKTKVLVVYVPLWITKVRMVKQVKSFPTQLNLDSFCDRDCLKHSEVNIEETRAYQVVPAGVSKLSGPSSCAKSVPPAKWPPESHRDRVASRSQRSSRA